MCGCGEPAIYAARHAPRTIRTRITENDYVVRDCGYVTPCWIWKGRIRGDTVVNHHSTIRVRSTQIQAHRAMYEQEVGPIPEGLVLDHLCKTKACLNPAHLEPVTNGENSRRAHRRLTDAQIAEIRTGDTGARVLAERFGVSEFAIYQARRGRTYADTFEH